MTAALSAPAAAAAAIRRRRQRSEPRVRSIPRKQFPRNFLVADVTRKSLACYEDATGLVGLNQRVVTVYTLKSKYGLIYNVQVPLCTVC